MPPAGGLGGCSRDLDSRVRDSAGARGYGTASPVGDRWTPPGVLAYLAKYRATFLNRAYWAEYRAYIGETHIFIGL